MSEHPNVQRLRNGYEAFGKGDFAALDDLFAEDVRWHEGGRSQLAGHYEGRTAVYDLFRRLFELTDGSFRLEMRTAFADDTDGVVVAAASGRVGSRSFDQLIEAHIWRFSDGRITEFWHAQTDQHAVDEVFG
jgi:ketosteroid isomerase-like protein